MRSHVTALIVCLLFIDVSGRRGRPKMIQSLEWKQGYSGWGMPTLDYSDIASPLEGADTTAMMASPSDVKEVKRAPKKLQFLGVQSYDTATSNIVKSPTTTKHHTIEEFIEMSDGLE